MTSIIQTVENGLILSLTVLALYLSYSMLNVCDLSTDGAFTLGAAVGTLVALSGHPYLAIPAAMLAGAASGFITAILQTKMGVDSLLAGIIVNTGLYSVNLALTGNASNLNLKQDTVFTGMKNLLKGSFLSSFSNIIVLLLIVAAAVILLTLFLKTRLGLALRATGNNPDMVRSSSINTVVITIIGLCLSNSLTGLSGALMAHSEKLFNIYLGTGNLTIALASLLIGRLIFSKKGKGNVGLGAVGAVIGSLIFRVIYLFALKLHMPTYLLKLVSSVIVIATISGPYFLAKFRDKMARKAQNLVTNEEVAK